jgi:hypothetical protein
MPHDGSGGAAKQKSSEIAYIVATDQNQVCAPFLREAIDIPAGTSRNYLCDGVPTSVAERLDGSLQVLDHSVLQAQLDDRRRSERIRIEDMQKAEQRAGWPRPVDRCSYANIVRRHLIDSDQHLHVVSQTAAETIPRLTPYRNRHTLCTEVRQFLPLR